MLFIFASKDFENFNNKIKNFDSNLKYLGLTLNFKIKNLKVYYFHCSKFVTNFVFIQNNREKEENQVRY